MEFETSNYYNRENPPLIIKASNVKDIYSFLLLIFYNNVNPSMGAPLKKQEAVRKQKGCDSEFGNGVEELGSEKARGHISHFPPHIGGGRLSVHARHLSRR